MDRDQSQTKPKSGELPGTSKDPTERVTSDNKSSQDKSSQDKSSQDKSRQDQGSSRPGSNYQNPQSDQHKRS